jgi:hypothetical protein
VPLFPFGKLVDENDYSPSAGFVDRTDRTDSVKGFFQFLNSHMGTPFRAKMTAARLRFRAALVGVVTALKMFFLSGADRTASIHSTPVQSLRIHIRQTFFLTK